MRRFIKMIITHPASIFQLIYYFIIVKMYHVRGKKIIVFNMHHDYFYDIFYSVYYKLKRNKDVVIFFAYLHGKESLIKYLSQRVGSKMMISNLISPFIPFDLFICPEITGPDFPASFLKTKTIEIYHGNGISGFYEKIDVLNRFNVHFAIGPKFNEFLDFAYQEKTVKPKIYNIGYPKLDVLLQQDPLTEKLHKQYKLKERFTILYAPHWNPYGSLHKFDLKLIELMISYDVNLLVKPHHYLYSKYADENWLERLKQLEQKAKNMILIERPNTQELYPLANLMVSDTGTSAPFEFSILQKPLFIFHNDEWFANEEISEEEERINEAAIDFSSEAELKTLLDDLMSNSSAMQTKLELQKARQQKLISDLLYNPGKATEKAYQAILQEL